MERIALGTPCPAPQQLQRLGDLGGDAAAAQLDMDEETCMGELDYTRAIQQQIRDVRPRPRTNLGGKRGRATGPFVEMFEDVREEDEGKREDGVGAGVLLGKPAVRMRKAGLAKGDGEVEREVDEERREKEKGSQGSKRDARRRTIFVPPDETSMLTIHPGAYATEGLEDTFQLPRRVDEPDARAWEPVAAEAPKPVRRPRMSMAVAPKRAPLQSMVAKQNLAGAMEDVPGQGGGKENIPPSVVAGKGRQEPEGKGVRSAVAPVAPAVVRRPAGARSRLLEPTAASQARQSVVSRTAVPIARPPVQSTRKTTVNVPGSRPGQHKSPRAAEAKKQNYSSPPSADREIPKQRLKRPTPPGHSILRPNKLAQYPTLAEDISQPGLYEDSWLSQQEVALSELINTLFAQASPTVPHAFPQGPTTQLRERMVHLYHQPHIAALHKRLQASLVYGGLSRPKEVASLPSPCHDMGLRKRFLGLWLGSYEESALRAAAEVVVGRQVPRKASSSLTGELAVSEGMMDPASGRRGLIGFLETFLIGVEDVEDSTEREEAGTLEGRRWRKMMLRSLMMVWLLDQAKGDGMLTGCLFKRTSKIKTSLGALQALSSLLMPSVGDITRVLRHFEYEVRHVQDPLDEVVYAISNIAVDLRDGIFLTRLVEVLVFARQREEIARDQDATVTITLPDATLLESAVSTEDRVAFPRLLSQHLKMPCLGKAQKLHNVQVALSALQTYGSMVGGVVEDVTAEDIVYGHREKTLSLLWSLVSCYGLSQLLDFDELVADVRRLGGTVPSAAEHAELLQTWAAAHCQKKGVRVANLTASFSDGQAYAAILDDFSAFLSYDADKPTNRSTHPSQSPLESRLRSLGCRNAFIKQLAASTPSIPSRNLTIPNLAFLASRLLPLARRHYAASALQKAWRCRLSRRRLSQRVVLMRLASACASVVQTQQKLDWAATVLQRLWRSVLDARIARLNLDVETFQVVAKGWAARRRGRKAGMEGSGAGSQSLRAMGGW